MDRTLLTLVAVYGFLMSRRATWNIKRISGRAREGDIRAQEHFTQTRYARVFGVRNSDLGMVFYGVLGAAAFSGLLRRRWILRSALIGSTASVALSLYLLWALLVRLKVICPVCLHGHAANGATFGLLLKVWHDQER
ncbi:MAG: vitamin K epoxide reductase family protein [Chloroflexota bacterium]|nr:vitamin K epoxide reductase family protein [Chloroflexota bacterium]